MKAVDTNVVLRLMLRDDPVQTPIAEPLFERPVFLGLSVLMETEWVLRSVYKRSRADIGSILVALTGIPSVSVPDEAGVRWAIARYSDHGADFDDMIHVVAGRGAGAFASFEKRLAALAGAEPPVTIERLG